MIVPVASEAAWAWQQIEGASELVTETDLNEQEQEQLKASQMDVVHQLYIGTADQDYITARWGFTNGFYTNFFWLGVHALEKYQKSVLLLNNSTSKKFSHNIVDLYKAITSISGDLLPGILTAPEGLQTGRDVTPEKFLNYLYARGNPHNRYLIFTAVRLSKQCLPIKA